MAGEKRTELEVAGARIAVRHRAGRGPGVVWLGGFRSDMVGTKAETLDRWAADAGHAFTRHDYSGHGESGGRFADGTISRWLGESLAVFRRFTSGPQVLVGSSMGAWIALRMAAELRRAGEADRIAGMVLLAPAPDFTSELMEAQLTPEHRAALAQKGYFEEISEYSSEPNIYTRALFDDGRENRVMTGPIDTGCKVRILQGDADPDVPPDHAKRLAALLPPSDVTLTIVLGGDHRLSRPEDLDLLVAAVAAMVDGAA